MSSVDELETLGLILRVEALYSFLIFGFRSLKIGVAGRLSSSSMNPVIIDASFLGIIYEKYSIKVTYMSEYSSLSTILELIAAES